MILPKVSFQGIIIDVILLLPGLMSSVTDMASLMLVPTMRIELVVTVKTSLAEPAFWVAFEATLIYCSGVVVTKSLVSLQLASREELVLVGKDLFVPGAEVTGSDYQLIAPENSTLLCTYHITWWCTIFT